MNKKFNEFSCNICNKNFKSYQSRWNHNKKFHNNLVSESPQSPHIGPQNSPQSLINNNNIYTCNICGKIYNNKKSKWSAKT